VGWSGGRIDAVHPVLVRPREPERAAEHQQHQQQEAADAAAPAHFNQRFMNWELLI
jgi:hypothetical protein